MPAPLSGQVALTASAQALAPANTPTPIAWTVKAPRGNQHNAYIGASSVTTSTGHILEPGDTYDFEQRTKNGENIYQLRPSEIYVVGTVGDVISWLGSP